jgi:hypothetical protein
MPRAATASLPSSTCLGKPRAPLCPPWACVYLPLALSLSLSTNVPLRLLDSRSRRRCFNVRDLRMSLFCTRDNRASFGLHPPGRAAPR